MEEKLLDTKALAEAFQVSVPTVKRWIADGVPCMRPSPGVVRFRMSEVVEWAQKGGAQAKKAAV